MVQIIEPWTVTFTGISSVNFIFGYVMNVKFWKILFGLLDTDVSCHVATARCRGGGLLFSSTLRCRECLSRHFAYLGFLHNPAPQGNWPHSCYCSLLQTWRRHRAGYVEESHYYVFEIYLASICTRQVLLDVLRILYFVWWTSRRVEQFSLILFGYCWLMTVHYVWIILLHPLVHYFNTLKPLKHLKHSYMFRHNNVIIRE